MRLVIWDAIALIVASVQSGEWDSVGSETITDLFRSVGAVNAYTIVIRFINFGLASAPIATE